MVIFPLKVNPAVFRLFRFWNSYLEFALRLENSFELRAR